MTQLQPGIELDTLIAEKVMGLEACKCDEDKLRADFVAERQKILSDPYASHFINTSFHRFGSDNLCNFCGKAYIPQHKYSTDIRRAWKVIQKLQHLHPHLSYCDTTGNWTLVFMKTDPEIKATSEPGDDPGTAPHAICLAALQLWIR